MPRLRGKIRQYTCTSVEQYLQRVANEISQTPTAKQGSVVLWRGQGDVTWSLAPGLQREWKDNPKGLRSAEKKMFEEFKCAAPYLLPSNSADDWDRLSIAQHFGMPTRLLDWTVNHMVALWFALSSPSTSDAAVWAFRPRKVNIGSKESLPENPFAIKKTTAFQPAAHSHRIAMQAGWHTAHIYSPGKGLLAIDKVKVHVPHLAIFLIPQAERKIMLTQLEGFGISATTVFGDLASLCNDIGNRYRCSTE